MKEMDNKTPHRASDYDQNVRQTIPFYETMHREIIDLVMSVKSDAARWLDTGCGTGYLVQLALPLFPKTQFIIADPSEAMLQQARDRLYPIDELRVRILSPTASEGLFERLEGTTCQIVTAIQCHHYLSPAGREEAVRTCFEVLESGGLFVSFENVTFTSSVGTQIGLERWGRWQRNAGRSPSEVDAHIKRFNTEYFPITVNEHIKLMKAVGFQSAEMFWFSQMQAGFYAIKG
jgi:tRNA (cmo5U34)-methyltransferase